jgi:hypothetical protein
VTGPPVTVRPYAVEDEAWAGPLLDRELGGRFQTRAGELIDSLALEGFTARRCDEPVGLLTYLTGERWIERSRRRAGLQRWG